MHFQLPYDGEVGGHVPVSEWDRFQWRFDAGTGTCPPTSTIKHPA